LPWRELGARLERLLQILETAFALKPWPKSTKHPPELELRDFARLDRPARGTSWL